MNAQDQATAVSVPHDSAPDTSTLMPPTRVMEGVTIALVRAPGGVKIGFSGP